MSDFEIVSLGSPEFLDKIEKTLNKKTFKIDSGSFADTESFVKTPENKSFENKKVFIVCQFSFLDKVINDQIFELLILSDLLKNLGAKETVALLPYLPYSRQGKCFKNKFSGPMVLMGKFLKASGIDEVVTLDLHDLSLTENFTIKLYNENLNKFWIDHFKKNISKLFENDSEICLVSPDKGRIKSVQEISQDLQLDFAYIKKERVDVDVPVALELIGDVKDKNIIIIDDVLDTGKTLINASNLAIAKGAKEVITFFTHAVFSKDSLERFNKSCISKAFTTNSNFLGKDILENEKIKILDISDFLIKHIV